MRDVGVVGFWRVRVDPEESPPLVPSGPIRYRVENGALRGPTPFPVRSSDLVEARHVKLLTLQGNPPDERSLRRDMAFKQPRDPDGTR